MTLCYSGSVLHAILDGALNEIFEVLNVRQRGQTVRTLSCIGCTANEAVQKVTNSIPRESVGLTFGSESATTVAMTGQRVARRVHAELVGADVPELGHADGVHVRLGWHKLQLALVLEVPTSKLSNHIVVDRLLLGVLREMHANRANDVVKLIGRLHHQQRYVIDEVIVSALVFTARDVKKLVCLRSQRRHTHGATMMVSTFRLLSTLEIWL